MAKYCFIIEKDAKGKPYMPPSLNKLLRSHWGALNRAIGKTWAILDNQVRSTEKYQFPKGKRRVIAHYFFKVHRKRDDDNWKKVLADAMVKAGIILDDDPEHLEFQIIFDVDPKRPRIEIMVEDIQE